LVIIRFSQKVQSSDKHDKLPPRRLACAPRDCSRCAGRLAQRTFPMNSNSWLKTFRAGFTGLARRRTIRNLRSLSLERLEDRTVPTATITWTGAGGDFNWGNPANLSGDALPRVCDDVMIDYGANDFTVVHSGGSDSVHSLTSHAPLAVTGGELLVGADSFLDASLTVGATFGGSGTITVTGPTSLLNYSTLQGVGGTGRLVLNGDTTLGSESSYLRGGMELVNGSGSTLTVGPNGWGLLLSEGSTVRNEGTLVLSYGDGFAVSAQDGNCAFVNAGLVRQTGALTSVNNGPLFNVAHFTNEAGGRIEVAHGLRIGGGFADTVTTVVNHGSITAAADATVALGGLDSDGSLSGGAFIIYGGTVSGNYSAEATTVRAGDVTFTGTVASLGAVDVNQATLDLSGATLADAARTLPSLSLLSSALVTRDDLAVTGPATFSYSTVQAVDGRCRLTLSGTTTVAGLASYLRGGYDLVNAPGGTVSIGLGDGLWLSDGATFRNEGTLELPLASGYAVSAHDGDAAFINTGLISQTGVSTRDAGGPVFYNIPFTNEASGRIEAAYGLGFGGGVVNHGSIAAASGAVVNLGGLDSDGSLSGGGFLINGGTVSGPYSAEATSVHGGTLTFTGAVAALGDVSAYIATLDLSGATLADAARTLSSLSLNSSALVTRDDLAVAGPVTFSYSTLQAVGGRRRLILSGTTTVLGSATYLRGGYDMVNAPGGTVSIGLGDGLWLSDGASFRNEGTLELPMNSGFAVSARDADSAFVNAGLVRQTGPLTGSASGPQFYISHFTNEASGRIEVAYALRVGGRGGRHPGPGQPRRHHRRGGRHRRVRRPTRQRRRAHGRHLRLPGRWRDRVRDVQRSGHEHHPG
jgi:hypothetical protein